jgi:hypothetical protein
MAYLSPHYGFDVFVSYSHGDPRRRGDSPLKRWTHALIGKLEEDILALNTEFDDLEIWRDAQIDPTAHLTEEIRGKVRASSILMIIMSKRYLASSWCNDEREWFSDQIRDRTLDQGRVFIVHAQATDSNAWPPFLRDERGHAMLGFQFFDPRDEHPFGWNGSIDNNEPFRKELSRLSTVLTRRLRELRQRAEARAAATAAAAAPGPANLAPRLFVHANALDSAARDKLTAELEEDGIFPITVADPKESGWADWAQESRARIEAAKRCNAMALVRVDARPEFVGELLDVGIDERERIQTERGSALPCAVLDRSGERLPIDVSRRGIAHFDIGRESWRKDFHAWLVGASKPTVGRPI